MVACGGGIYLSCLSAAESNDGKMIGVDVDQSFESDTVITSAMKGLAASVQWACAKVYDGSYAELGGTCATLGAKDDAVGLPTATWSLTGWTVEEYNEMVKAMADGTLDVQNEWEKKITDAINNTNVGPLGLGGKCTAMGCFLKVGPIRASGVRIVCARPCCTMEPRVGKIVLG